MEEEFVTDLSCVNFFITDSGREIKEKFDPKYDRMSTAEQGWLVEYLINIFQMDSEGYVVYIGDGYVPLTFAVFARSEDDAIETVLDWCRENGRQEDIAEGPDEPEESFGEVQIVTRRIPVPNVVLEE